MRAAGSSLVRVREVLLLTGGDWFQRVVVRDVGRDAGERRDRASCGAGSRAGAAHRPCRRRVRRCCCSCRCCSCACCVVRGREVRLGLRLGPGVLPEVHGRGGQGAEDALVPEALGQQRDDTRPAAEVAQNPSRREA